MSIVLAAVATTTTGTPAVGTGAAFAATGGVIPGGASVLLWAPLLGLLFGLGLWLVVLVALQRRASKRRTSIRTATVGWAAHVTLLGNGPRTQP